MFSFAAAAICFGLTLVSADTEIVNFSSKRTPHIELPPLIALWRQLSPNVKEILEITPAPRDHQPGWLACNITTQLCPHEHWFVLDTNPGMHTLRISYPATDSVQYNMRTFAHDELAHHLGVTVSETARKDSRNTALSYVRIACRWVGVLTPGTTFVEPATVSFHFAFESLVLGIIPPTVLPALAAGIALICVIVLALPRILAYFEDLSGVARAELKRQD
ncbi:hypothetical protein BKA62DRAFT_827107 [Auriculariales sp. MPI-PUGE-AT-0066]|nr:hypothetical protein BKA62DRAFT_827107 [Auriculariales sp. MPI-PUGE-AT-0066]